MFKIYDRVEKWEITEAEFGRLRAGNHRIFTYTKKAFKCEHCNFLNTFYIGVTALFCNKCLKGIPKADELMTDIGYRIKFHLGKEKRFLDL